MAFGWKFKIAANIISKSVILPHRATFRTVICVAKRAPNVSAITLDRTTTMSMREHVQDQSIRINMITKQ